MNKASYLASTNDCFSEVDAFSDTNTISWMRNLTFQITFLIHDRDISSVHPLRPRWIVIIRTVYLCSLLRIAPVTLLTEIASDAQLPRCS